MAIAGQFCTAATQFPKFAIHPVRGHGQAVADSPFVVQSVCRRLSYSLATKEIEYRLHVHACLLDIRFLAFAFDLYLRFWRFAFDLYLHMPFEQHSLHRV